MSKSDDIRALARKGMSTADIARQLNIRYQHAYNVLRADNVPRNGGSSSNFPSGAKRREKPPLSVVALTEGGFSHCGRWIIASGELKVDVNLPAAAAVYAFANGEQVLYVGVATMGLAKRLYFYGRPGATQRTSKRVNALLKQALETVPHIDIYAAFPPDLGWNGLPVHGSAGLELGIIKKYALPWNLRSAK